MISIIPATENDIDFILSANAHINHENGTKNSKLDAEALKRDIFGNPPVAFVDIAWIDNKAAGLIFYSFVYFANDGQTPWVSQLYTDPVYRQRGIAKTLVGHLKKKYDGKSLCWATVNDNHGAQNAFEKIGAKKLSNFIFYKA